LTEVKTVNTLNTDLSNDRIEDILSCWKKVESIRKPL
jgi:hypothetical protein